MTYFDAHWTETVKIVNLRGLPSKELAAEMVFDFHIETLGMNHHVNSSERDLILLLTAE